MESFISGMIGCLIGALYADHMYRKRWNEFEKKMEFLCKRVQIKAGVRADGLWK